MDKRYLEQCEREPLHLSGAIQPHGALLVLDASGRVSHVSANIEAFLAQPPEALLGAHPPVALAACVATLHSELTAPTGSRRICPAAVETAHGVFDVVATRDEHDGIALELSAHLPGPAGGVPDPERFSSAPASEGELVARRQTLVEDIATLTGFQRVVYCRFCEDDDGEVVAEARRDEVYGSYLGLRFPASDIPLIARNLYRKNPWRLIPDATVEPVPLLGRDGSVPDLTWIDLRSVSPVHRVYMGNMGVRASLSLPVVANGTLKALVTAHHSAPRVLPPGLLQRAAALVRAHALAAGMYQAEQRMRLLDSLALRFTQARAILHRHGVLGGAWPELGAWLQGAFEVDGAVLCTDGAGTPLATGLALSGEALARVEAHFAARPDELIWLSPSLTREIPGFPVSEVAGVLALRVRPGTHAGLRIYLTRGEQVHEVAWGGNPHKPVERHDGVFGIAPRHSFEKWVEKRLGYCRPWRSEWRLLAFKLRELLHRELHG